MAPKVDDQTLPNKEQALFRALVKQYEGKLYKKGIKTADSILRKFPNHGETMSMKGLILNCQERKPEAYDLVKRGVKANLRSHICWHVYGLVYRSDREYDEAIKCYKNALRMDPDNLTVLRDLAQLQVQMRDLPGYLDSRQTMLEGKPGNRQNWVAFAAAHHLCGNHEVAAKVLDSYEATQEEGGGAGEAYERGEVALYKASILEEGGRAGEALAALDSAERAGLVRDRLGAAEARGRLCLSLGRAAEAEAAYRRLLASNVENYKYHDGLRAALAAGAGGAGAGAAAAATLAAAYEALQRAHPHASAPRRIPLDFLEGTEFVDAADAYVRRYLARGIPSLFSDLKPLYADAAKAAALGALFSRLEAALESTGAFPPLARPPAYATGGAAAASPASPQALVWARLYLAQHHDRLGATREALRHVDACLAHTPTLVEAHGVRARVLKHAGDAAGAAAAAQAARAMDLADRYLNGAAAKALFRAGRAAEGEAVVALFTREGDPVGALYEMQATWYEVASGRAYLAAGDRGRALKRFLRVDAHWADFVEDQFDFHAYCTRKQTMRAYVDMLRMVDRLYAHPVYGRAVAGAVAAYISLHDSPPGAREEAEEAAAVAGMSADEAKRYRQRRRKEEARRQKEGAAAAAAAEAEAAAAAAKKGGDKAAAADKDKKKEPDPDGLELAATPDPLGEAAKLTRRLVEGAPHRAASHLLAFEVALRRGKLLAALRAVRAALVLEGPASPEVHRATVRLAQAAVAQAASSGGGGGGGEDGAAEAAAAAAREVLGAQVAALLGGAEPAAFHAAWAREHGGASLPHRAAAAEMEAALRPEARAQAARGLAEAGPPGGATHAQCVAVEELLGGALGDAAAAAEWRRRCAEVFRWSRHFGGPECVPLEGPEGGAADVDGAAEGVAQLAV